MAIVWTISDLAKVIESRRQNKFDCNIAVSGPRGNGKSTAIAKLLYRVPGYNPWKHQVYSRKDVIKLLESQKFGIIFDDEAINSSYKRSFYDQEQQQLIRMLNMYRDNFNLYAIAIPNFYSLDRDIRGLIAIHLHVVKRGVAIVHIAETGRLYSDDAWNVKYNMKLEDKWAKKIKRDATFNPPYHKLSTFKGYLYFSDLTPKQREIYEKIKFTKRKALYDEQMEKEDDKDPIKKMYNKTITLLLDKHFKSMLELQQIALSLDIKWEAFQTNLRNLLKDMGKESRLKTYFVKQIPKTSQLPKSPSLQSLFPSSSQTYSQMN